MPGIASYDLRGKYSWDTKISVCVIIIVVWLPITTQIVCCASASGRLSVTMLQVRVRCLVSIVFRVPSVMFPIIFWKFFGRLSGTLPGAIPFRCSLSQVVLHFRMK